MSGHLRWVEGPWDLRDPTAEQIAGYLRERPTLAVDVLGYDVVPRALTEYAPIARIRVLLARAAPVAEGDLPGLAALTQAQRELERLIVRAADELAQREPPPVPDTWTPTAPVRDLAPDGSTYDDVSNDLERGDR